MNKHIPKKIALTFLTLFVAFVTAGCDEITFGAWYTGTDPLGYNKQAEEDIQKENQKKAEQAAAKAAATQPPATTDNPVSLYVDRPDGEPVQIVNIGNILGVSNGGTSPTVTFEKNYYITEINDYHWNNGAGTPPGTIALKSSSGTLYGPWQATLVSGVYWIVNPNTTVPAGSYTVIDSDPSTWAQNSATNGQGMVTAQGIPVN